MSNEAINSVTDENFGPMEMDAIGEIQNITMGSAATAVSNLLNAKVWITTPSVSIVRAKELVFPDLEPSIRVKIEYIKGVSGSSVMILKQSDVQLMLNQLMGLPLEVTDDFQFDEMNISAVCEVMNQMMGASSTALSKLINTTIDISTPEATISLDEAKEYLPGLDPEDKLVKISFDLTIDGVIKSEFISILSTDLAKNMARKMLAGYGSALDAVTTDTAPAPEQKPAPAPIPAPAPAVNTIPHKEPQKAVAEAHEPIPEPVAPAPAPIPTPEPVPAAPVYNPQPQYRAPPAYQQAPPVNVQNVQLHSFENYDPPAYLTQDQSDNLKLLMGVPLNVTVEIGSTQKKVKEILEFTQGTIIELERQAGAPVDVIVNGHLIAKGDVVVIEDNFAVRITEIIKSRFLDSLGNKE